MILSLLYVKEFRLVAILTFLLTSAMLFQPLEFMAHTSSEIKAYAQQESISFTPFSLQQDQEAQEQDTVAEEGQGQQLTPYNQTAANSTNGTADAAVPEEGQQNTTTPMNQTGIGEGQSETIMPPLQEQQQQQQLGNQNATAAEFQWFDVGHAIDVVAMTYDKIRRVLYAITSDDVLWVRDPVFYNKNWHRISPANPTPTDPINVVAMTYCFIQS